MKLQLEKLGPAQDKADADRKRDKFYVYILDTDYGHYIGHTVAPRLRYAQHTSNQCHSTAFSNPKKLWLSHPQKSRAEAMGFEATLKSLRDTRHKRFAEITGVFPKPMLAWKHRQREIERRSARSRVVKPQAPNRPDKVEFTPQFDLAQGALPARALRVLAYSAMSLIVRK